MILPKALEPLRARRVWICYPMIWNAKKHNGVGGYDKPPVNPYTLYNGSTDDPKSLATFDDAAAQIGKTATVRVKGYDEPVKAEIVGVGIAVHNTGVCGLDLDNVYEEDAAGERRVTREAVQILSVLKTYTEVSPSGKGLHALFLGELPKSIVSKVARNKPDVWKGRKAEYQLFDSGYLTVSGKPTGETPLAERTVEIAVVYEVFFSETEQRTEAQSETPLEAATAEQKTETPPIQPTPQATTPTPAKSSSSVVSSRSGFTYERWLEEVKRLGDKELLERIFSYGGAIGARVRSLYYGDISAYGGDHSAADQALCSYLYSFTNDRDRTRRLFEASSLYRKSGKSRNYVERTLNKAETNRIELVGHIEFTREEKRAYAKQKEAEEKARNYGGFIRNRAKKRGISK